MPKLLAEPQPRALAGTAVPRRQELLTPEQLCTFVTSTSDRLYRMSADWSEMRDLWSRSAWLDTTRPNANWLHEYVHPDDRDLVRSTCKEAVRGKRNFDLVHRMLQANGSFGWTRSRAVPLLDADGEIREWFGAATDINGQKQARHLMDQQALQFEALLDNAPIGVCLVDQDLRITSVNPIAMCMFGTGAEIVGLDFDKVSHELWPARYADEVMAMLRHTLSTGEPRSGADRGRKTGKLPAAADQHEWQVNRIALPGGGHGVVCYFKDLSALARSKQALEEADRRKDEFLATLAHELRTPLGPLRNCLHVLRLQHDAAREPDSPPAPDDPCALVAVMEQQVRHMVRLVDDLLEVSRITRGDIDLRREPVDLGELLMTTAESSRQLADAAGHRLEVDIAARPLPMHADAVRLTQVVSNLLNNAVKYTPAGGRIRLVARREGDSALITVSDTGSGIPDAALRNIFDMFVQGEHTRSQGMGGLGIGLTLVRNLVTLHGGTVEARSEGPGRGSEFLVRLPLQEVALPAPAVASSEAGNEAPLSILVIDDSHQNADTLAMFLEMSGHRVRIAYDGASGLEMAGSLKTDVILLDLGMPGMDGYETCRRLRALPGGDRVRVVAVTGWGQKTDRLRTAESGFDQHLVKPVDPGALLQLLAEPVPARAAAPG